MKIGYARVSKADGSQALDLQVDALINAGVFHTTWVLSSLPEEMMMGAPSW